MTYDGGKCFRVDSDFIFDLISIKYADNKDRHKISYNFGPLDNLHELPALEGLIDLGKHCLDDSDFIF